MGRLTRLTLFTSALGAGIGALIMPGAASAAPIQNQLPNTPVTVKAGDTLSAIAAELGTTWPALASYNQLANPNLIFPGEQLRTPPSGWTGADPAPATASASTVQSTDYRSSSSGTTGSESSSFEQCVIQRESGGNAAARNGQYWGLYQFSYSTWVANGGSPSAYGQASAAEQHAVFARSSASNWAPYDGC